ncbi:MAG: DUF433 domain-containing protein [Planctomycetes bacterium]|nr:DUF433 domain-containing protein [Planctomycetota bacterium]
MAKTTPATLGLGTYTIPEAAHLVGVAPARVRRWIRGYAFETQSGRHHSPPVWRPELGPRTGPGELGFRDLMELRVVTAFLERGVSWPVVRRAHRVAERLVGHPFPFSTHAFSTDGSRIFAEAEALRRGGGPADLCTGQSYFDELMHRLVVQVEFGADELPARWWPMGPGCQVLVDPRRSYGQPIVAREGVPTRVLAEAVRAGDSRVQVARWFEVSRAALEDALRFERHVAA